MEIKKNWLKYLIFIFVFLIFFIRGSLYLDPDFGYRLQNGRVILNEGIKAIFHDRWSYTMEGYSFVEHSWATAVFWALSIGLIGYKGIAAVYSFIAVLALLIVGNTIKPRWLSSKALNIGAFANPLVIISFPVLLRFFGIRAQVVTWFFFSILVFLTFNKIYWKKFKYLLPLMFLFWSNLHGGFAIGIFYIFTIFTLETINIKSKDILKLVEGKIGLGELLNNTFKNFNFEKGNFIVVFLSLLATFINPYGPGLWKEVLFVVTDTNLRWKIHEWYPYIFNPDFASAFFLVLSIIFILRQIEKIKLSLLVVFVLIFIQAQASLRHLPIWIIFSIPLTTRAINSFYEEVKNKKFVKSRLEVTRKYLFYISIFLFLFNSFVIIKDAFDLDEDSFYPKEAVVYLKNNEIGDRIFTLYRWGGYMVWKYPEKQVFINGQMPSWEWKNAPEGKLRSAFLIYDEIIKDQRDFVPVFDEYKINKVLLPKGDDRTDTIINKLSIYLKNTLKINIIEKESLEKRLKSSGWKNIYSDSTAVIYEKY